MHRVSRKVSACNKCATSIISRQPRQSQWTTLRWNWRYPSTFLKQHPSPELAIYQFPVPPDKGQAFNLPFTLGELDYALKKANGKSAGPDEIGYPMLKNLPPSGRTSLLTMINQEWMSGTIPELWKHSYVAPIPKNSGSPNIVSNYRPIALTSCIAKLMERMVNRRLIDFLEEHRKLDSRQHAFRPGYGAGSYMASLGQILDDAIKEGLHIEMASLDLAKAYNRAWTPGVLNKLASWGITGNLQ